MVKSSILRLPENVPTGELLESIMEDARNNFHHSKEEFGRIYPGQEPGRFTVEVSVKKIKKLP